MSTKYPYNWHKGKELQGEIQLEYLILLFKSLLNNPHMLI